MVLLTPIILSLIVPIVAIPVATKDDIWQVVRCRSLVTFGDSYTDENRGAYFGQHNGTAPPPGTFLPESNNTLTGGRTWARYVVEYVGILSYGANLTLYNYAVNGAVCSNNVVPKTIPDVLGYELPAFLADQDTIRNGTTTPFFTPNLTASDTVYAIWIGTNDIGLNGFLTNGQRPGKILPDQIDCVYDVLDGIYAAGGRIFVIMSTPPLHLAPLYANETLSDGANSTWWPDKPAWNATRVAETMLEYTSMINTIHGYRIPHEVLISGRFENASFAYFDVNRLMQEIYRHPEQYFTSEDDGTVSGRLMWSDALHPSMQTCRIIAWHFLDMLDGGNDYAEYW